jgi:hypothetical protein
MRIEYKRPCSRAAFFNCSIEPAQFDGLAPVVAVLLSVPA